MTTSGRPLAMRLSVIAVVIVVAIVATAFSPRLMHYFAPRAQAANEAPEQAAQLAAGKDSIYVPADIAAKLGLQTSVVESSSAPVTLEMSGTLMLNSDRLSHVRARFPGEIVELGAGDGRSPAICFGQKVKKGQLLAVIWSQDLGEKKSELIDALSQQRVDEDSLERIAGAAAEGSVPERLLHDAQRKVEADRIAVSRAERTLQTWRISREEIDQVRAEAQRLLRDKAPNREELVTQWAKLEVRAPLDGTVIECDVALGDLVDTSTVMFEIADLTRLRVVAHAYEEDLPSLDAVKSDSRAWSVAIGSGPDAVVHSGQFDQVGCIIDPNQHTAMVMGWVESPHGGLRVGQFVTVSMPIPPPRSEVVIPAVALCEEGGQTSVFMHPKDSQNYVRQAVVVSRRSGDKVYVRSQLTPEQRLHGLEPLAVGQLVVTSHLAQLTANLNELKSAADKPHSDKPGA